MKTVRALVDNHALQRGEKIFLIAPDSGHEISFSALKLQTDRIGAELDRLGIPQGAKVAFLLNNGAWTTNLFLGVMSSNRVIVPLNAVAGTVQLQHVLNHSDAEVVLVSGDYRSRLDELLALLERDITVINVEEDTGPIWPGEPLNTMISTEAPFMTAPGMGGEGFVNRTLTLVTANPESTR